MISLAITNYNRSDLLIESFISVIDNKNIDEILISDDCSDIGIYNKLEDLLKELNNKKIKLIRNKENIKPFFNKYEAIKNCKNDWAILLDSDNKITNDYIQKVTNIINKNNDTIYVPQILMREGFVGWNYSSFANVILNKTNIKDLLNPKDYQKSMNIETMLNTGNFFVNKNTYISTIKHSKIEQDLFTNDASYFSYLWLKNEKNIMVLQDLQYYHRIHDGSWYLNNSQKCSENTKIILQRIIDL